MITEKLGIQKRKADRRGMLPPPSEPIASWLKHVKRNHGGDVSQRTIRALTRFYNRLKFESPSLFNKILVLNPIVPDGMEAALTPLIDITNKFSWINVGQQYKWGYNGTNNFDSFRLTKDGLSRVSITNQEVIDTQFNPSLYLGPIDGGTTFYISESPGSDINAGDFTSSPRVSLGCYGPAGEAFRFDFKEGLRDWIAYPNQSLGSGVHFGLTYGSETESVWQRGFLSFNQSGFADPGCPGNDMRFQSYYIWKANDAFPMFDGAEKEYGCGPSASDPLPNFSAYFLSLNNTGEHVGGTSTSARYSFAAIHKCLTSGEAASFYGLIVELRENLGGGARTNI